MASVPHTLIKEKSNYHQYDYLASFVIGNSFYLFVNLAVDKISQLWFCLFDPGNDGTTDQNKILYKINPRKSNAV